MTLTDGHAATIATVLPERPRSGARGPPRAHDARREARPAGLVLVVRGPRRPGLDPARRAERLAHGIGQVTRVAGAHQPAARARSPISATRSSASSSRRRAWASRPSSTRRWLHGVMARDAICFPQSIGQAATWDPALVERIARLIGRRLRAMGASQALAPVLDMARDPRWGRFEETYGEDPYLVAVARLRLRPRHPGTGARRATRHRHGQAHGRPRRAGGRPQPGTRAPRPARAARRLPAALRGRGA